jgi:hypothetical protein
MSVHGIIFMMLFGIMKHLLTGTVDNSKFIVPVDTTKRIYYHTVNGNHAIGHGSRISSHYICCFDTLNIA